MRYYADPESGMQPGNDRPKQLGELLVKASDNAAQVEHGKRVEARQRINGHHVSVA